MSVLTIETCEGEQSVSKVREGALFAPVSAPVIGAEVQRIADRRRLDARRQESERLRESQKERVVRTVYGYD